MKSAITLVLVLAAGQVATTQEPPPAFSPSDQQPRGPKIQFATPVFDFGKISSGEVVKYSYIFTNVGNQTLYITNVQPSCGCTAAADWTRQVEPGKAGSIPIQFNSANFGGMVAKMISVASNDKSQPLVYLQIKGNIWKPVEVTPNFAVLNVLPDAGSASATVKILSNLEEPLTLGTPQASNPLFTVQVKTNVPGKEYELNISADGLVKSGNVQAQITIPTSATNVPQLAVTAWANIQPAISILPTLIQLPSGPLANTTTPVLTIINNTTNPLTLSDAALSATNANFQLREVQPGKYFTVAISFPPGFEMPQGQQAEFRVKSSNPKLPLIQVPIVQQLSSAKSPTAGSKSEHAVPQKQQRPPTAQTTFPPPAPPIQPGRS